jgi:hypothetical protein
MDTGAPITVHVTQEGGGDLIIEGLMPAQFGDVFLVRDGKRWDLGTLSRWAQINGVPRQEGYLQVPRLPAGGYMLCGVESNQCLDGWLMDQGSLSLQWKPSGPAPNKEESQ